MISDTVKVGDIVVFTTKEGTHEGKIVKVYDDRYFKVRYFVWGFIPVYRIDTNSRMLAHKPKIQEGDFKCRK